MEPSNSTENQEKHNKSAEDEEMTEEVPVQEEINVQ
jgi:hypothetical protein